ncbi:MAG TPA: hypothetical protein VFJ84_00430 [Candidatus Saccharimonadales bacterium]|nr:hypothetical protein [Candidatus Saccharimonadales bacterium]
MTKLLLPRNFRDIDWLESKLKNQPEKAWQRLGNARALNLFHEMSQRVPAYKDFLKKNGVNPATIRTVRDFRKLPAVDKDNYLRVYPRKDLVWDGKFKQKSWTISTTSGSTGKPYYFPRQSTQDWQYAKLAELYLRANFHIHERSTLYIVAFPMGAWIGGLYTYEALKLLNSDGEYALSIITPGINKLEILEAVRQLGKDFDQIIIGSYAPFLKDILDDGESAGIKWSDYNLGFIFSAEGFSEIFRDYVFRKTGIKDIYRGTLNHYGTVDLGTMAHETPLAIKLRRDALLDQKLYGELFSHPSKLPTLTQYNPALYYFEEQDSHIYCSAFSGIPLVRYDLKDNGGVVGYDRLKKKLLAQGYDMEKEAAAAGIGDTLWRLPFVYVYERADFSVSYYAFLIYAEMVRRPLQAKSLEKLVTGKFSMRVYYDDDGQQKFEVNVELKAGVKEDPALAKKIQKTIAESLIEQSSEYRETYKLYGRKIFPEIIMWPYEHHHHFKPGGKQKWVTK